MESFGAPGGALFVCVVGFASSDGPVVRSPVLVLAAADSLSSSSLHVAMADFRSSSTIRAGGGSRRWLLRQFKALKLLMEEEDGYCLVPTIFASGREFRGGPRDVLCFMFNTFPFRKKKSLAPV